MLWEADRETGAAETWLRRTAIHLFKTNRPGSALVPGVNGHVGVHSPQKRNRNGKTRVRLRWPGVACQSRIHRRAVDGDLSTNRFKSACVAQTQQRRPSVICVCRLGDLVVIHILFVWLFLGRIFSNSMLCREPFVVPGKRFVDRARPGEHDRRILQEFPTSSSSL